MSKDWTPLEHYLSELYQTKRGFGDIFNFMESLKMVYNDGTESVAHPPEEMALRKQFPCLGKYLFNDFITLYKQMEQFEGGIALLHEKDTELSAYIKAKEYKLVTNSAGEIVVHSKDLPENKDSYLIQWWHGELVEHFYYNERNNELLISKICAEAWERGLSNWILTDPDCLQMRCQIGFEGRGIFELIQIEQIPDGTDTGNSVYLIADGEIDFDDFPQEEINSALDGFGYDNMKSLIQAAGSRNEAYGQLAEMLFELSTSFYTMRFNTWDEALAHIEYRTGKDLSGYRDSKEKVKPLSVQIEAARSKSSTLFNGENNKNYPDRE